MHQPNPAEILRKVNESIISAPDEIAVNVIISGNGAKKFHIIRTFLSESYPDLDIEEIDKYILRSGVERELAKIASIWQDE
jgi:hypothetical protein